MGGVALVCAIGDSIHLWDMRDGEHLDRFRDISRRAQDAPCVSTSPGSGTLCGIGRWKGYHSELRYRRCAVKFQVFDGEALKSVTSICFCETRSASFAPRQREHLHSARHSYGLVAAPHRHGCTQGSIACCAYSFNMSWSSLQALRIPLSMCGIFRACSARRRFGQVYWRLASSIHPGLYLFVGMALIRSFCVTLLVHNLTGLAALPPVRPFRGTQWFSEYAGDTTAMEVLWDFESRAITSTKTKPSTGDR